MHERKHYFTTQEFLNYCDSLKYKESDKLKMLEWCKQLSFDKKIHVGSKPLAVKILMDLIDNKEVFDIEFNENMDTVKRINLVYCNIYTKEDERKYSENNGPLDKTRFVNKDTSRL